MPGDDQTRALVDAAAAGSVRAIARLVTQVEGGGEPAAGVARALLGRPRRATVVGLTGSPGVGKSTLTAALVARYRERGATVAVLAVDPSSPFTGGALLGDRVRMAGHSADAGVFIRSMSSRGALGGLSAGAPGVVDLLSALAFDLVLVETVGVGQNEVAVLRLADTVVVVLAPGMGDGVQAAKAGILEIADVLVVNKADRAGAADTVRELRSAVALGRSGAAGPHEWRVPVLRTVATEPDGIDDVIAAVDAHAAHQRAHGGAATRARQRAEAAIRAVALDRIDAALASDSARDVLSGAALQVLAGASDQHHAAEKVLAHLASRLP